LFVLQGHSSTTTSTTASPVVSAAAPAAAAPAASGSTAATEAQQAAAPTSVYHGAAPGVEGLTKAIAEAHGAVATSQGYANKIEQKSEQASDTPAPTTAATAPTTSASPTTKAATPVSVSPSVSGAGKPVAKHSPASSRPSSATGISKGSAHTVTAPRTSVQAPTKAHAVTKASPQTSSSTPAGIPAGQQIVEGDLNNGSVVLLYFFTPSSPSDLRVQQALQLLDRVHQHNASALNTAEGKALSRDFGSKLKASISVIDAAPSAASFYGSITNGIQIYSTPTLLIVTKTGKTLVLSGLQDAYSIEQAVEEARTS
jgi:hypothetical protein